MISVKALWVILFSFSIHALGAEPLLEGELTQGSLIRGQIAPQSQVFLNEQAIAINTQGQFVLGFGRDAELLQTLRWELPQGGQGTRELILKKREYKIDYIEGVAQKYVSPPEEVLARIRADNAAIAKARRTKSLLQDVFGTFILPSQGRISGVYGSQRYFNGQARRPHFGLDIANQVGTPVIAPSGGIVRLVNTDMYYSGGTLIIDHGMGVSSTFIHLHKILVEEGQRVEQGELIAEIGATGRVTGPHLDWRINWFKERLDPALLLEQPVHYQPK